MEKREPLYTLGDNVNLGKAIIENSMLVPQKTKIQLSYDTAIPLLGKYPKETKPASQRDICIPNVHCSITITKV